MTVRTHNDPFDTKKFSNLNLEILVEWIVPNNFNQKHFTPKNITLFGLSAIVIHDLLKDLLVNIQYCVK